MKLPKWLLNQNAGWKRKTGDDEHGQAVYAGQVTIKGRWEYSRRLVRDKYGKEVLSEALFFCHDAVGADDLLNDGDRDWPVIVSAPLTDWAGRVSHYEVSL